MQLSQFIVAKIETILQGWEDFARSIPGHILNLVALRDDAERMLRFIAQDLETEQSERQQLDKSLGLAPGLPAGKQTAAMDHGLARALDHFTLTEMVAEYRALRASVTRLWLKGTPTTADNVLQLVRFNEAVDQILAESVARFTEQLDTDADLFAATISHDLRNPVNAVVMSAQLLSASKSLSQADRVASARIERSATRIGAMLRELEDYTHVRLGRTAGYKREATDVAKLCRGFIDEIEASHPGRRIILSESGDTTANVDRQRVGRLVSNLIGNAIQHGSQSEQIAVRITGADRDVAIEVHNEGSAVAPEDLKEIFEPLRRAGRKQSDADRSLGLGLYIAQTIAVAHGGSIDVTSTTAAGTTFVVRLPRTGYAGRQR
jgi:signal transduction histidine kinase